MTTKLATINGSEYFLTNSNNAYKLVMVTGTTEPKDIAQGSEFECMSAFIDIGVKSQVI
jgi:hypothetical protein